MAPLLEFKAGRSFREGETNQVVSNPDRGLVYLEEEDGLLHFYYKDLNTSSVLEDLIIFPGDASFQVANKAHRVSVLKFNSSSARHFFWHQDRDLTEQNFEDRTKRVNELIGSEEGSSEEAADGGMEVEAAPVASSSTSPATISATSSSATSQTRTGPPPVSGQQALQLENILSAFRAASGSAKPSSSGGAGRGVEMQALQSALRGASQTPEFLLSDVLSPSALTRLVESLSDGSLSHLSSFLPSTLPTSTAPLQRESLVRALVTSPEFRRSTESFDRALRTGATGPVLRSLGMTTGERGVEEFLNEILKNENVKEEETGPREEGVQEKEQEESGSNEKMQE